MKLSMSFRFVTVLLLLLMLLVVSSHVMTAQTESASISGVVTDSTGAVVPQAEIILENMEQGIVDNATTNHAGIYVFPSVRPGQYRLRAAKAGFKRVDVLGVTVNVQDHLEENFRLEVGSASQSVTVSGESPLVNTQDASVSTVVDRNFAENLPLNGRSFQTLIFLTPGTVATAAGGFDSGQFSVNGQRPASNYWMVDGVAANVGINTGGFGGDQASGSVGTTSVFGGTNSLVSVDALQEFRVQTSTFAPEYGRTPGAQISIVTRSGTNNFHGTAFDYLRNDALDANNWFNGYTNFPALQKAREKQNDFGGTIDGPIVKSKSFFFFSYEGLRLRLPNTALSTVPDAMSRQNAAPGMQPFLDAFPLDPNQPDLGNGIAQFNATFSNPASLNDYSIRIDHKASESLRLFGRYNYSPSEISERGVGNNVLSTVAVNENTAQQLTAGATWAFSPRLFDEFRINYSRTSGSSRLKQDTFAGATPVASLPFPSPFTEGDSNLDIFNITLNQGNMAVGVGTQGTQRQFNVIDTVAIQVGSHNIKGGVDYRRLTPVMKQAIYSQVDYFLNVFAESQGGVFLNFESSHIPYTLRFQNFSAFVQDSWRMNPRLTATYGLRWDVDSAPITLSGPVFPGIAGLSNFADLSRVTLAPSGSPAFNKLLGNLAPRIGVAYQLFGSRDWETITRGGVGMFYDLATSETANVIAQTGYPFASFSPFHFGGSFSSCFSGSSVARHSSTRRGESRTNRRI